MIIYQQNIKTLQVLWTYFLKSQTEIHVDFNYLLNSFSTQIIFKEIVIWKLLGNFSCIWSHNCLTLSINNNAIVALIFSHN